MLTLHSREHRFLFGYLLLATGLLAGLAAWVLCHQHSFQAENVGSLSDKLRRLDRLFKDQKESFPKLDSAYQAVVAYNPQQTAVFLEADIDNQLSDIRQLYVQPRRADGEANDTTHFYRAFDQVANFYQMLYRDKKILAATQGNIVLRAKQLEECTADFQAKGAAAPVVQAATAAPLAAPSATPLLTH